MTPTHELSKTRFMFRSAAVLAAFMLNACATTGVDERVSLATLDEVTPASQLIVLMVEPAITVLPSVDDDSGNDDEDSDGPGLIASLIFDSLGKQSRERSLEPITPHIDAHAWANELSDRMRAQGLEQVLAQDASVSVVSNPIAAIQSLSEGRSSLLITLRMGFDHRLQGFFVESEVALHDPDLPVVRARYISEFVNPERYGRWQPIKRKAPNIEYWTRNGGAAIHAAMTQAQTELMTNMETDFQSPVPLGARTLWLRSVAATSTNRIGAQELERRGNRVFVATTEGRHWLDSIQVDGGPLEP